MRPELQAVASRQGGVITRRDAVGCGYSERELKTLTGHRGAWVIVRRGCYAERLLWDRLDEDGRYLLRVRAAVLQQTSGAVVSHTSAAALHGMPLRPRWRDLVHVTRPGVLGSRTEGGVKHHRAAYLDRDLCVVDGICVTNLARTAVDIGREHGYEDGTVAADAALRIGGETAGTEEVHAAMGDVLSRMVSWPYVTAPRAAVAVADGGAAGVGETLLRLMVIELGIGRPETQYPVVEGGRRADVDVRVGRHLFEFDGRIKYVGRERGGVADRPVEEILWQEKQREDWLRRVGGGHGVSRVVWSELFGEARKRTMRRLHDEYQQTLRRFGE